MSLPSSTSSNAIRFWLGAPLAALCLAGAAWTVQLARVAVAFGKLPPPTAQFASQLSSDGESIALLERLVAQDPDNGVIRKRLASELARRGDYAKAFDEVQRAQTTANTPDGVLLMADLLDKRGEVEAAAEMIDSAAMLNPDNPQVNEIRLRMLGRLMAQVKSQTSQSGYAIERDKNFLAAHLRYALAARDWEVRAPNDRNAYLFLANDFVGPPVFALQAYRLFLIGLSGNPGLTLSNRYLIEPRDAIGTINQIYDLGLAPPYRGIRFNANAGPAEAAP